MSRALLPLLVALAACSSSVPLAPSEVESDGGSYVLHLTPSPSTPVSGEEFTLGIMVHDASDMSAVSDATVEVEPWMPDMGHGIPTDPMVMEMTDMAGMFDAAFAFSMPGYWEVTIDVDSQLGEDAAVVAYEVE